MLRKIAFYFNRSLLEISEGVSRIEDDFQSGRPIRSMAKFKRVNSKLKLLRKSVRTLFSLTRIGSKSKTSIPFDEIVEREVAKARKRFPLVDFKVIPKAASEYFYGVEKLIQTAITELLENAAEATLIESLEPKVVVSTEFHVEPSADISKLPAKRFVLKVSDNARGFAKEALENAFTVFFTTRPDSDENPRGLGLLKVKNIADVYNSEVEIDSTPSGSTVSLNLQSSVYLGTEQVIEEKSFTHETPSDQIEQLSIEYKAVEETHEPDKALFVVVDDDEVSCETIEVILNSLGFECKTFINPEPAKDFIAGNMDSISCVLLDYHLEIRNILTPLQIKSWCINEEMAVKRDGK